jgi:sugar phosphate isomerase/epimerase
MVYTHNHHRDSGQSPSALGMFVWFGYDLPIRQRLRMIRQAGFETTSIWWGEKEGRGAELYDLPAMVREAGLQLDNAHLPYEYANLLWCDSGLIRHAAIEQHIRWLHECASQGVTTAVMHLTQGNQPPEASGEGVEGIRRIVKAAEQLRMVVAIENIRSRRHLDLVFAEIESEHLAFCYDTSHDWLWNTDTTWLLRWLGSRLAVTHFSDNDGVEDRHWLPGTGVVDWQTVAEAFPHETYGGSIHLEVLPTQEQKSCLSPEQFLTKAYEKAAWLSKTLSEAGQAAT